LRVDPIQPKKRSALGSSTSSVTLHIPIPKLARLFLVSDSAT
jgi:hypothetical protein